MADFNPQRRYWLGRLATLTTSALSAPLWAHLTTETPGASWQASLLSAATDAQGQHYLVAMDTRLLLQNQPHLPTQARVYASPTRMHGAALHPQRPWAAFVARRPGTQTYIWDWQQESLVTTLTTPEQGHFYGHGVFSADGRFLYSCENTYHQDALGNAQAQGLLSCYQVPEAPEQTWQRVSAWPTAGIGPHELKLSVDGESLWIANGGLLTHPDYGRVALNLPHIDSALVQLNRHTGEVLAAYRPQDPLLSLRHLDQSAHGDILVGYQYQGTPPANTPLLAYYQAASGTLTALQASATQWQALAAYIASVAITPDSRWGCATAPRGHQVSLWDLSQGRCHALLPLQDAAGVRAYWHPQKQSFGFLVTSGTGVLAWLDPQTATLESLVQAPWSWDNHLSV
ncbi:hypothetical protein SAMN05421831_11427 [Allopseudospirillum japonicum]|uniref:DUF1513 domain-containing protein n=1 Tax=Allopseudospirillum japonicum TaxID=64971 RepID=A0A1H6UFP2_9GAMM|nr:DUF1513 domain-containing protein [Allopseudospirillum japonicum]SEI86990.1 hypothetical protein SAMN05421831_11427 [Allopseudospirillum japonicum]